MGKKRFVCTWVNNWREITERKVFTLQELGFLLSLQTCIGYRNNIIRNPDTGTPLSKQAIADLVGKSIAQTDRILQDLVRKIALIEGKEGKQKIYTMNPCLFWKGTEKDKEYTEVYSAFNKIKNIQQAQNPESYMGVRVNGILIPLMYDRDTTHK